MRIMSLDKSNGLTSFSVKAMECNSRGGTAYAWPGTVAGIHKKKRWYHFDTSA
jgi:hypothetical protein